MILDNQIDDHLNESNTSDDESVASSIEDIEDNNKEETQVFYKESFWPAKPDTPKGFTFKGRNKMMAFAMEKIKNTFKTRMEKEINVTKFKILDSKLHGGATQIIVEIISKAERGIAIAEFWGPNKRKECTILIKKSKEHDEKFVSILAKKIIQPCLDNIMNGKSLDDLLKKRKINKCSICDKNFSSSKYLKVHITKIHTTVCNKCEYCEYTDDSKAKLKNHIKTIHEDSELSQPPPMDTQSTQNETNDDTLNELEINSWEEKRMDDQLMDTETRDEDIKEKKKEEDAEIIARSNYRDEQIKKRARETEENEKFERIQRENSEKNKSSQKKTSTRKKKRKKNLPGNTNTDLLPAHLKCIPDNIKHLTERDNFILKIVADGACAPRAGAAHVFEDQNKGIRFRSLINAHISDRFWSYYCNKIKFPYKREMGINGKTAEFTNGEEYVDFLRTNPDALFLWSDNEELLAIANLCQMDINIIKTKGPDDKNPLMFKIKADANLADYAIFPKGKLSDMTVVNTSESHYDLLVSKTSRLAQKSPSDETDEKTENILLREELKIVKTAYTECLKYVEKLKNEWKDATMKKDVKKYDEHEDVNAKLEEQILIRGKSQGFTRDGPQFSSYPKPFTCEECAEKFKTQGELKKHAEQHTSIGKIKCDICTKKFKTKKHLNEHMSEEHSSEIQVTCSICEKKFNTEDEHQEHRVQHRNDGDWNCNDCAYQTNSKDSLKLHLESTHHSSQLIPMPENQKFNCNLCESKFYNKMKLEEHKQRTHKAFKPCKNLPNCSYGQECFFNHNKINRDMFLCYECGIEEKTLSDLMIHRKNKHVVNDCLKYYANVCRFTSDVCWFNHKTTTKNNTPKVQDTTKVVANQTSKKTEQNDKQQSVFRDSPENLAPPSQQPTQATWLRMIQMMDSLNKMMKEIREASPFL